MGRFLKENWMWIVAPMVLIAILVIAAAFFLGDGDTPFDYALF